MENQIYSLVDKLVEIFDVQDPSSTIVNNLKEQFVLSARQPPNSQPIDASLDTIAKTRGPKIWELFNELMCQRNGRIPNADQILHMAVILSGDDSMRKFIKVHDLLRKSKAKKDQMQLQLRQQQLQHQQQQQDIHQQTQHLHQQTPQRQRYIQHQQTPQQQQHYPQQHHSHQQSQHHHDLQLRHDQMVKTPATTARVPKTPNTGRARHNSTLNISNYQSPRDVSRKNDVFYLKMKSFLNEHPFLSFDFKKIDWLQVPPVQPLKTMSVQEQENALINDLCHVLTGMEGKYIRMQPSRDNRHKHTIGVERDGDELVYTSATRIIKICPLYSTVVHFAEDVNFGLVNQALSAPVRELVKEYLYLISNFQTRLSNNELTLQSMWLSLQTIFYRMEALKQVIDQISKQSAYGGHTLSILHNQIVNFGSDPRAHEFCLNLMLAASVPYLEILERWLYLGVIEDPFGEFFIEDREDKADQLGTTLNTFDNGVDITMMNPDVDIDTFWRSRFKMDDSKIPEFLRSKQDKIYDCGRFLSVVRRYGKKVFKPLKFEPLIYNSQIRIYDERIDEAYKLANKELLYLLLEENKLIERLQSFKRFYLFSSGDLFVQFMDMAEDELSKTKEDIKLVRLESLLDLALRTSSCHNDPYQDDVQISLSDGSLYQMMSTMNRNSNQCYSDDMLKNSEYSHLSSSSLGWESMTLTCDIPWPLSMIICKDCQDLYRMMFKHLFCCKYVERKLESTWRINRLFRLGEFKDAFSLRHQMLNFVHTLLYYTVEIIEPSFQLLIDKFKDGSVDNVNDLKALHKAFLSGLVHDSMLTDNELLCYITKLLLLCMDFSVLIETNADKLFQQRISEISRQFDTQIFGLLKALKKKSQDFVLSSKLINIYYRLDYNDFYSKRMKE